MRNATKSIVMCALLVASATVAAAPNNGPGPKMSESDCETLFWYRQRIMMYMNDLGWCGLNLKCLGDRARLQLMLAEGAGALAA